MRPAVSGWCGGCGSVEMTGSSRAFMTSKAAEKIIEALTQLMEGYCELQEAVENDYGSTEAAEDSDGEGGELNAEADAAIVTEMRAAIESVLEAEDYTPDELASVISTMTDALEEIDPEVFEKDLGDEEEDEDYDDEDLEDYDDEDYEDDDEEESRTSKKKRADDEDEEEEESDDDEEAGARKPSRRR